MYVIMAKAKLQPLEVNQAKLQDLKVNPPVLSAWMAMDGCAGDGTPVEKIREKILWQNERKAKRS